MVPSPHADRGPALLRPQGLQRLLEILVEDGLRVLGPVVRDGAIVYDELRSLQDLPAGWTDRQGPAGYALERRDDDALFGYAVGPDSCKRFLHPPRQALWSMRRADDGTLSLEPPAAEDSRALAFIGMRACELRALAVHDRILRDGDLADTHYAARRQGCFIVAVHCNDPADTCFCASLHEDGPRATEGFDLALSELVGEGRPEHVFVVEAGTPRGIAMLARLPVEPAGEAHLLAARERARRAAQGMRRHMPVQGLKQALQGQPTHPHWEQVAERCLGCANCTMVCPTCFCTTVQDHGDLSGSLASRERLWDSCFTLDFSYVHGGSVRTTAASRYRQWMTHKLAHWHDEFGGSGCVGCGRCISWCPAGIDITQEAAALHAALPRQGGDDA